MPLNPLIHHYSMENPASVYDEEAMTALELAGRTASKVNEVVKSQNELREETEKKLADQDLQLINQDLRIAEDIPKEVEREVEEHILSGAFDRAISEYANDLEARVDNLLENVAPGGTSLDAEVIDIRVDDQGTQHENAGTAVRQQGKRLESQAKSLTYNDGVYALPLIWTLNKTSSSWVYECKPFLIPEDGVSIRVSENGPYYPNGVESHIMHRQYLGTMVNGEFVTDSELTARYCTSSFARSYDRIPHIPGVYVWIRAQLVGSSKGQLNEGNYEEYLWLPDMVKAYTGKVKNGGNLLGTTPATLVRDDGSDMKYTLDAGLRGLWWKFCCLASPLPLQFVNRVTCNPDIWLGAKVYRFDPTTRKTEWVKTMHYNQNAPVFGTECVLDFSEYGENYYALLAIGKVPLHEEYQTTGFNGSTSATSNITRCGLNLSDITNGVHVEWVGQMLKDNATGGSPVVQRNIELIKNLTHKTVPAMYGDDPSQSYNYILGMDRFAGAFYGGGYAMGTFFYNVAPVAYYTALLNPNSVAYGSTTQAESGFPYGIMCSAFTSLLHGYPLPLSTFDYRYNHTIPYFETKPLDLMNEMHKFKVHDIITQGAGHTGHSVLIAGVMNVGNIVTAIQVMESATPGTKENIFWLHNGLQYFHTEPETWYQEAYDFHNITNPEWDQPLHKMAEWNVPYTEPQRVMCSRGYGSVYVRGKNQVILSVEPEVTELTITIDGADAGTYAVGDLGGDTLNGYVLVNITDKVRTGTIRVRNNLDDGVEEFHVVEPTGYTVNASLDGNVCHITTNHPEEVKYINVKYRFETGDSAGGSTNMTFIPDFDNSGHMTIPSVFETNIGRLSIEYHDSFSEYEDFINLVFITGYDTNTFAIDAQGDIFN